MEDKKQPIVIKRIKKGHGHHGGAWKVAFADFVTAMMAFFLLMWLVGASTTEQKAAISEYFENPSLTEGKSQTPSPGPMGPGGASTSMIKLGGTMEIPRGDGRKVLGQPQKGTEPEPTGAQRIARTQEKERLEALLKELQEAVGKSQALKPFKDQLLLDITPEGLRIQIVDKENRPMFDLGSTRLKPYTVEILHEIAHFINEVPNKISITGHTDATPFVSRDDYSNWELSADRANAARRELIAGGMAPKKIGRVVGLASSVLFDKAHPRNPINRRISIIVMNKRTADAIRQEQGAQAANAAVPALPATTPEPAATAESQAGRNTQPQTEPAPPPSASPKPAPDDPTVRSAQRARQAIKLPPVIDPALLPNPGLGKR